MAATAPAVRDRCPKCCGLLAVTPREFSVDDDVVTYAYQCPDADCRHAWIVRWALGVLGHGLDGAA
jgi:hypothetical protein